MATKKTETKVETKIAPETKEDIKAEAQEITEELVTQAEELDNKSKRDSKSLRQAILEGKETTKRLNKRVEPEVVVAVAESLEVGEEMVIPEGMSSPAGGVVSQGGIQDNGDGTVTKRAPEAKVARDSLEQKIKNLMSEAKALGLTQEDINTLINQQ